MERSRVGISDPICDQCGEANERQRHFCRRCGKALPAPPLTAPRLAGRKLPNQLADGEGAGRPIVETFRLLALNVTRLIGSDRRAIVVMSAWPNDGRSLVAISLARALAEVTPPVLLVDADPAGAGVDGQSSRWGRSGGEEPNLELLAPARDAVKTQSIFVQEVRDTVERAVADGRTVVIDTPACTTSSIAFYLASSATGLLYVARRRAQDSRVHADIRAQLDLLRTPILGVVFNEG